MAASNSKSSFVERCQSLANDLVRVIDQTRAVSAAWAHRELARGGRAALTDALSQLGADQASTLNAVRTDL